MVPTDRVLNLVHEQIDVGIRIGGLPVSNLIAIRVGATRRLACASPVCLAARGMPRTPEDLAGHDCSNFAGLCVTRRLDINTAAEARLRGAGEP